MEARIQSYLRAAASGRRDTARVGPFLAAFDPHSDNPYRNYALPDDRADPSPDDVRALVAAFEGRGRAPRLEYLPAAAPAVEAALLAAGFAAEGRLPLLVATPGTARDLPRPPGVALAVAVTDDDLLAAATAQNAAYGEPATTRHDVARLREGLAAGGSVVLARDAATAAPIGAGLYAPPRDGVTEIAAIGVIPAYRRRGVAGALCAQLLRAAFAAGVTTPFLMPAGAAEERIYARAGFARVSEILHISRPRAATNAGA